MLVLFYAHLLHVTVLFYAHILHVSLILRPPTSCYTTVCQNYHSHSNTKIDHMDNAGGVTEVNVSHTRCNLATKRMGI